MLTVGVNGYTGIKQSAEVEHCYFKTEKWVAKVVQKYRSFIVMANNIQSMEIAICSLAKRKTFVLTVIFERHWCSSEECFKF